MSTTFYRGENPLYADKLNTAFSERVSRGGDTMQGFLTLAADPVQPFDAATKQYVDRFTAMGVPTGAYIGASPPGNTLAPLWWDNVSGQLFIQYNDGSSTQWVSTNSTYSTQLPLAGGVMTGPLYWTATGSTASRSAQDRSSDWQNVRDFGAMIDGTTQDGTAIGSALAALKTDEAIYFPAGNTVVTWGSVQGTTPSTPVHFLLDGTQSSGNPMVQAFSRPGKGDLFETFHAGTKYLTVESASPDAAGPLRIDFKNTVNPGTKGFVSTPIIINANDYAGAITSIWGLHVSFDTYSTAYAANGWPQHVGISSSVRKHGQHWLAGIHITSEEDTNHPSSANDALIGMEIGHQANAADDGGLPGTPGLRLGIHLSQNAQLTTGGAILPAEFGMGYCLDGGPNAVTKSCFGAIGPQTYQVFDARSATAAPGYGSPVAALRMDPGQIIDFNGANTATSANWKGPPGNYLQYTRTGTPRLRYMAGANEVWSVSDAGAMSASWIATGSVASRAAQDRSADWVNLKDYGAVLDGVVNDSTAYAAARTAASSRAGNIGGVIVAPPNSKRGSLTAPIFSAPAVLWQIDGMSFGTSGLTPVTAITTGDTVETFFTGQKYFGRTDPVGVSPSPVMRIDYSGAGTSSGVLQLNVTGNEGNAYTTAILSRLTLTDAGTATGPTCIAAQVTNIQGTPGSGSQGGWTWWGVNSDQTGLGIRSLGGQIGMENGVVTNGLDVTGAYFNPAAGGRVNMHLVNSNFVPPSWAANHAYAAAAVVTPGNGYVYIAQNAGTSGASAPAWPTSAGTVVDSGVTWAFGTTVQGQVSRALHINGNANLGAAILIGGPGSISDAGIDMCQAILDTTTNPNAAAIRVGADMPIDFSGDGTAAGQNRHTLEYRAATQRFYYAVAGVDMWSVDASGNMRCAGTITGNTTP